VHIRAYKLFADGYHVPSCHSAGPDDAAIAADVAAKHGIRLC
jgi:hypothetical protein